MNIFKVFYTAISTLPAAAQLALPFALALALVLGLIGASGKTVRNPTPFLQVLVLGTMLEGIFFIGMAIVHLETEMVMPPPGYENIMSIALKIGMVLWTFLCIFISGLLNTMQFWT